MENELYHYVKIKKPEALSEQAIKEYNELFPMFVKMVSDWWSLYPVEKKIGWQVVVNPSDGIIINNSEKDYPIIIPANLDSSFKIGWCNRNVHTSDDPKKDIAEKLLQLIEKTNVLKYHVEHIQPEDEEEDEDDDRREYYGALVEDSEDSDEFTPYSGYYRAGDEYVYCLQGESPDYTACDKDDCGYCGRCRY